ncbi:hypothetical protein [Halococcus thailandensis]|uniref:Uncharacterized protein n=1 Tax=Halococcus thailandensis JCM 13552 TaxID=1227457 RepID=M0NGM7_9EURY|nr:hypothetical protein [Halococcus thailandensis]EMA56259.1 hypothetical protein C451_03324 [Halococcus thailandensis JCM 13552]
MDEGRRISPFAEDTLALLTEAAGGSGEELTKNEAFEVIRADKRFGEADAQAALTELESRGYIYYVDETVRITPTDE